MASFWIGALTGGLVVSVLSNLYYQRVVDDLRERLRDGSTDLQRLLRELRCAGWIEVGRDHDGKAMQITVRHEGHRQSFLSPDSELGEFVRKGDSSTDSK